MSVPLSSLPLDFAAPDDGGRLRVSMAAAALLLALAAPHPAFAIDKPPLAPDPLTPAVANSSISATIEIGMKVLSDDLEQRVPRRLATFNDRMTECWHKRILGRMINVDCIYSGYIERTGSVPLRAEGGRLTAATPLFGTVSAQGAGRFTSMFHGTAEGQMTVYASARPQLLPDWSVSLDMSEGFRWTEPPTLTILGFHINLQRYVEPRIRDQLARIKTEFEAKVRALDVRGKAEFAWRKAFEAVQIVDTPAIWLQTTPQSMAFSGIRVRSDMLEGSVEIRETTETLIGSQPPTVAPTPLPRADHDVTAPGQFTIILPLMINYDQIRDKLQQVMAARAQNGGLNLRDLTVYPSAGKLIAGLRLASVAGGSDDGKWIYLTANPQVDADNQSVNFTDLGFIADPSLAAETPLGQLLADSSLLPALRGQLQIAFKDEWQKILASANARLTRPLGNGFRSEGHLTSAGLSRVLLLPDAIRMDLRASGDLRLLYGM